MGTFQASSFIKNPILQRTYGRLSKDNKEIADVALERKHKQIEAFRETNPDALEFHFVDQIIREILTDAANGIDVETATPIKFAEVNLAQAESSLIVANTNLPKLQRKLKDAKAYQCVWVKEAREDLEQKRQDLITARDVYEPFRIEKERLKSEKCNLESKLAALEDGDEKQEVEISLSAIKLSLKAFYTKECTSAYANVATAKTNLRKAEKHLNNMEHAIEFAEKALEKGKVAIEKGLHRVANAETHLQLCREGKLRLSRVAEIGTDSENEDDLYDDSEF